MGGGSASNVLWRERERERAEGERDAIFVRGRSDLNWSNHHTPHPTQMLQQGLHRWELWVDDDGMARARGEMMDEEGEEEQEEDPPCSSNFMRWSLLYGGRRFLLQPHPACQRARQSILLDWYFLVGSARLCRRRRRAERRLVCDRSFVGW